MPRMQKPWKLLGIAWILYYLYLKIWKSEIPEYSVDPLKKKLWRSPISLAISNVNVGAEHYTTQPNALQAG